MKIFIPVNQKGGVGKTFLACSAAYCLADKGDRVLLADGDEQRNATDTLGAYALPDISTADLFGSTPLRLPDTLAGISLLRADPVSLRAVERSPLADEELVANLLARLAELAPNFDYAVFDTPGSNSRIANALLFASNFALIPCKIDEHSISVAGEMIKRIEFIQQYNPALVNLGILVNEYDKRQPEQVKVLKKLMGDYKPFMFEGFVADRSAYREAIGAKVPVWKLKEGEAGDMRVKSAAREAGNEIRAVFKLVRERMEGLL